MSVLTEIQGLFTPAAVAATMEKLPVLTSSVIDTLYPEAKEHPFTAIGLQDLEVVVGTQPVVRRDGAPIPFAGRGDEVNLFAPRPLKPSVTVTASELNDLKIIWGQRQSRDAFVARKVDQLRQLIRNSTEGMASVTATTGKLSWPSRLEGGAAETYELDFGQPNRLDLTAATAWDGASPPSLADVYNHLSKLDQEVTENGGGGNLAFLAGRDAFSALIRLAEQWQSTAGGGPINLKLDNGAVNIGGYEIKRLVERYLSPLDGGWVEKIPPNVLLGYSRDQKGAIFYLAVDSLSLDGQARPFHVVAEPAPGDTAIHLIAQAKPVPARAPRGMILSQVAGLA